jgi:hypothetical protein
VFATPGRHAQRQIVTIDALEKLGAQNVFFQPWQTRLQPGSAEHNAAH